MSGHSKWSKIKRKKATTDAKRGNIFTKVARQITIATSNGLDPKTNFKLRLAIEAAKKVNLPKNKIQAAIDRADKKSKAKALEEMLFQIRGPEGVMIIAEAVTDNRNRTTAEMKALLNRLGGQLTDVKWQFQQIAQIVLPASFHSDELELELIDRGAEDFVLKTDKLIITGPINSLEKITTFLKNKNIEPDSANLVWQAVNPVNQISERDQKIIDALAEHDDIETICTNLK